MPNNYTFFPLKDGSHASGKLVGNHWRKHAVNLYPNFENYIKCNIRVKWKSSVLSRRMNQHFAVELSVCLNVSFKDRPSEIGKPLSQVGKCSLHLYFRIISWSLFQHRCKQTLTFQKSRGIFILPKQTTFKFCSAKSGTNHKSCSRFTFVFHKY